MTDTETWRDDDQAPTRELPDRGRAAEEISGDGLRALPPLVFAGECDRLRHLLGRVARGEAFLLQGGLHARTYGRDTADVVRETLRTMMQMSALLTYAGAVPVVKVCRIAHHAARPGMTARYQTSAATLNLLRAFASGRYGGLRQVHAWNRDFVASSPSRDLYAPLTAQVGRALDFMAACGSAPEEWENSEFFASHEAHLLDYERALTRVDSRAGGLYDTASHLVWAGSEDADGGALVDHLAGTRNPVGVVLGPGAGPDDALASLERLDPHREPGRLTFVVRMGAAAVRDVLPAVVEKVTAQGHRAVWVCDAARGGSGESDPLPRTFDDVLDEVTAFFAVHRELGTHPGGLHLELAAPDAPGVARHPDPGLPTRQAAVPCLSRAGALDLAFLVADLQRGF